MSKLDMEYRDKLLVSDLPNKQKEEIKLLTLCNYGQVRSVSMAMHLSALGYKNVYATGFMRWHPSVISRQIEDSDLTIVCNRPNLEELFLNTDLFTKRDNIPSEFVEKLQESINNNKDKIVICNVIGYDRWGNPAHPELRERIQTFLSEIL
jgi:hypothetical protein